MLLITILRILPQRHSLLLEVLELLCLDIECEGRGKTRRVGIVLRQAPRGCEIGAMPEISAHRLQVWMQERKIQSLGCRSSHKTQPKYIKMVKQKILSLYLLIWDFFGILRLLQI
jgi:hypothetical protein